MLFLQDHTKIIIVKSLFCYVDLSFILTINCLMEIDCVKQPAAIQDLTIYPV